MEEEYILCYVQREKHRDEKIGSPPGNARTDGAESFRRARDLHGYGIARRIEQVSEQVLQMNEGTVYTSLLRLQQRKWNALDWGTSENNRKAKYYSITRSERKQLARETDNWERIAGVIGRLLKLEG